METRTCKTCLSEKSISDYRCHLKKGRWYYEYECRLCGNAKSLQWYRDHRERSLSMGKARYAANQERQRERGRKYYRDNRERSIQMSIEWRKANRESDRKASRKWRMTHLTESRLVSKRRRAKIAGAKIGIVRKADIQRIFTAQGGRCAICKERLTKKHIDHILPLALGGAHEPRNFQLTCPSCNLSKSGKHPVDFMQSLGFLL